MVKYFAIWLPKAFAEVDLGPMKSSVLALRYVAKSDVRVPNLGEIYISLKILKRPIGVDTMWPVAECRAALAVLCDTYWHSMYAYVRQHGVDAYDARGLTRGFLT